MKKHQNQANQQIQPKSKKVWYPYFLLGFALIITGTYFFFTKKAINVTVSQYNQQFQNQDQSSDILLKSTEYFNQKKEIEFLESKYQLAKDDSVGLIINLKDSTLSLQLKGIILHSGKINLYSTGGFFLALNRAAYLNLFSKPWFINNNYGTVIKEPITVKNAPKDTIEAQNEPSTLPDTTIQHLSNVVMLADNNIRIMLIQENDAMLNKNWAFIFKERWKLLESNATKLIHLKLPEYIPTLKIIASEKDITTIYRSLPENPRIVVYMSE